KTIRSCCRRSNSHHRGSSIVNAYRAYLAIAIPTKAAPTPILRRVCQTAHDRIAMHVAELLHALSFCPNVEVVKPCLPESILDQSGAPALADFASPGIQVVT